MSQIKSFNCKEVKEKFNAYPKQVRDQMLQLRNLIFLTAEQNDIDIPNETLKWGEPAYRSKNGTTIRIDWKTKNPYQYAMYFQCTTSLVSTFSEVFGEVLRYEKNRAILFDLDQTLPEEVVQKCIVCGLRYHKLKQQPFLGLI